MDDNDFKELNPEPQKGLYSSEHVMSGIPVPKTKRVENRPRSVKHRLVPELFVLTSD